MLSACLCPSIRLSVSVHPSTAHVSNDPLSGLETVFLGAYAAEKAPASKKNKL